jgi:hypothetical protein
MSELKLYEGYRKRKVPFLLDNVLEQEWKASKKLPDEQIGLSLHVALDRLVKKQAVVELHNALAEIRKHKFDKDDTRIRIAIIKNLQMLLAENPPPTGLTNDIKQCVNCALMKLEGNPEVLPGSKCSLCDTKQPTVTSTMNPKAVSSSSEASSSSESSETQSSSSSPEILEPQGPNMWLLVPYAIALAVSIGLYK